MNAVANDYGELLREKQPRVVKSEEQNERYIEYLRELCSLIPIRPMMSETSRTS